MDHTIADLLRAEREAEHDLAIVEGHARRLRTLIATLDDHAHTLARLGDAELAETLVRLADELRAADADELAGGVLVLANRRMDAAAGRVEAWYDDDLHHHLADR